MTSEELLEKLREAGIEIPEYHMRWLRIVHDTAGLREGVDQKKLFVENHQELPPDFRPADIDSRIYTGDSRSDREGELTLLGVYLLDAENNVFNEVDSIVRVVRRKLKNDPLREEISSIEISDACNISEERIAALIPLLRDLGFHHGFQTRNRGDGKEVLISVDEISDVRAYLNYESVEQQLEKRVTHLQNSQRIQQEQFSSPPSTTAKDATFGFSPDAPKTEMNMWDALHPKVSEVARHRFEASHYADAVAASLKELETAVSEKAEDYDRYGRKLMHHVFSSNEPVLSLTDREGDTGENIQTGYRFIFAGTMAAVRNPNSHHNLEISPGRAVHLLFLVSLLFEKLGDATLTQETDCSE
jgi:uncharacterized protein (TIGR02391 family)